MDTPQRTSPRRTSPRRASPRRTSPRKQKRRTRPEGNERQPPRPQPSREEPVEDDERAQARKNGELLTSFLRRYEDQERRWDSLDESIREDFAQFVDFLTGYLVMRPGESELDAAHRMLDLGSNPVYNDDDVTESYYHWCSMLLRLHLQLKFSRMDSYEGGRLHLSVFASIRKIRCARQLLRANLELRQSLNGQEERMGSSKDADLELLLQEAHTSSSDGEKLFRYVTEELYLRRLGRRNGAVYRRVFNEQGVFTRTWARLCDVKKFIYDALDSAGRADIHGLTLKNTRLIDGVEKHLKECRHPWFPEIIPRRGVYSFQNGMLSVEEDPVQFWTWDGDIPSGLVACKYFDQEFDPNWVNLANPWDIPTPAADRIVRYQLESKVKATPDPADLEAARTEADKQEIVRASHNKNIMEVMEWIFALIGRLQHPVRKHDNWEVLLTVIGRAGTGKSTMMEAMMNMYDKEDVRQLSGNADHFSIASLVGGLFWMCTEMSDKVRIPQMQLQQMVTGEAMSVRPIHADWIHIPRWESPGVIGGNVLPPWADNQGSLSRRLLVLTFGRAISSAEKDPKLKDKLGNEMGAFICKVARYYWMAVKTYGKYVLWADCPQVDEEGEPVLDDDGKQKRIPVLPPYFHEQSAAVKRELDPLRMFLAEATLCWGNLRKDLSELPSIRKTLEEGKTTRVTREHRNFISLATYMMPVAVFKERATEFMNELGKEGKEYKWKESVYRDVLVENDLVLFTPSGKWPYGDKSYSGKWIAGICELEALTENNPLGYNMVSDLSRDEEDDPEDPHASRQ